MLGHRDEPLAISRDTVMSDRMSCEIAYLDVAIQRLANTDPLLG
jgi:hypothetical protein